jgi:hypothetical protein
MQPSTSHLAALSAAAVPTIRRPAAVVAGVIEAES